MKRIEAAKRKEPMVMRYLPSIPEPPKGGVVVKTSFCGICHSDVHMFDDEFGTGQGSYLRCKDLIPGMEHPFVLGHEIAGTVHSLGKGAENKDLKIGDKVVVFPWIGCDDCGYCTKGLGNYCTGQSHYIGCSGPIGGYSEYVPVCHYKYVLKVPESLPLDIAGMLTCSGVTGYNAVENVKPTIERFVESKGKATLLIIGAGGLGLWCLQTARAVLPKQTRIIIADIGQDKLKNAMLHGADDTVFWDPSLSREELINRTKEKGTEGNVQAVIDFVNSSSTTAQALGALSKGGALALVGLFGGALQLSLPLFASKLHQVLGVFVGSLDQMKDLLQLAANTKLKPPAITHVKLEDVPEILEKLRRGEITGRAIVKF